MIAILIAGIMMMTGHQGLNISEPPTPEVEAYSRKLDNLSPNELVARLGESPATPKLLYLYTSWCPFCKRQWPIIEAIHAKYGKKLDIIPVSVDQDAYALAKLLMKHKQPLFFEPYIIRQNAVMRLQPALQEIGIDYNNQFPTLALLSKGKVAIQGAGLVDEEQLSKHIDKLLTPKI